MNTQRFEPGSKLPRRVADAFLPDRGNYYYARCKLAIDPLYDGVCRTLADCEAPLLDLGCGIGLLAQTLAASGVQIPYLGIDNDAAKLRDAQVAAQRAGLRQARFAPADLSAPNVIRDLRHHGSVAILDLLQYVPPQAQTPILEQAIAAVSNSGRLVIRTGLADRSWRAWTTHTADSLANRIGWMNTDPKCYPQKERLQALLDASGLIVSWRPLRGKSPFNNWLILARRPTV